MDDIQEDSRNQTILKRLIGFPRQIAALFVEPSRLFSCLTGKMDWLIPFLVVAVLGGLVNYATRPIFAKDMYPIAIKSVEKYKSQIGEEEYQKIVSKIDAGFAEAQENPFKWYYIFTWLLYPLIVMTVISLIGMITGNFIFGGKANFWIIMNVVAFGALIGLLGDMARAIMILSKDTMYIYTGMGLLKSNNDGSFIYYLLRQIDLFSIWRVIVTAIGLGGIYNMKPRRFYFVLVPLWLLFVIFIAFANSFIGGTIVY
jgi:hypothetical protein